MRNHALGAAVCAAAILAAGCGSTDAATTAAQIATPTEAASKYPFFDPCDEAMTAWLAERGFTHPEIIDPLLDENGSGCSYDGNDADFAVLSRPSIPGDAVDTRVHQLLGRRGPIFATSIAGHPTEVEVIIVGRKRQNCNVVTRVSYGFLDIEGGPNGKLAPSYPRDCDAVLTFADMLTREVDKRWQPED